MDQIIQLQIDQDNFLAECVVKANEAMAFAAMATPGPWRDDNGYRVRREDGQTVTDNKHCDGSVGQDSEFIAHTRTSNPDLATRVLQLVELVRERDKQIATLNQEPATFRCDKCRLYMSEDQTNCPNCGARQDGE